MEKNYAEMIVRIRELKMEQHEITCKLASEVMKQPALVEALQSGLMRLNFPAPAGFYRAIRNNWR